MRPSVTTASRARYRDWTRPFRDAAIAGLRPGTAVLDVGGGRRPALARDDLPPGTQYIGLDLSMAELEAAGNGTYDRMFAADVVRPVPELFGSVDLAVSWQVLEHVAPLDAALENIRAYLRPGGRLVAQLSGGRALFALINRAIPQPLSVFAMEHLLGRDPDTVFPAAYDRCTHTELTKLFAPWTSATITPRYAGAYYFSFFPPLERLYLGLEDLMERGNHADMATHYLIVAER